MRTSHAQLLEKSVSVERKTPEIKFCQKEYIAVEKAKIIEIKFLFCLRAG